MKKLKVRVQVNEVEFSWGAERVLTTDWFWDCECAQQYINPRAAHRCSVCKAERPDSPDSRVEEVIEMLLRQACEDHRDIEVKTKESRKRPCRKP